MKRKKSMFYVPLPLPFLNIRYCFSNRSGSVMTGEGQKLQRFALLKLDLNRLQCPYRLQSNSQQSVFLLFLLLRVYKIASKKIH
jgi:hypothetical protein